MKSPWKYVAIGAAAAAAAGLAPFKVKYDRTTGELEYRSFLLGVTKKYNEELGKNEYAISTLNVPKLPKVRKAHSVCADVVVDEAESVLVVDETELAKPEEAVVEEPAKEVAEEAVVEEPAAE